MTAIDKKDRCIALTRSGDRCSRIAKDGRFCFQHDSQSETVPEAEQESRNGIGIIGDRLTLKPEQLDGVQKDIAQNVQDVLENTKDISDALKSMEFSEAIDAFRKTASSTASTPAKFALVGGAGGAVGGPIGMAAGGTAGLWYGVYKVANDDRAVLARIVEEPPIDAEVVSSDHEAIADVEPIQMAMKSAAETAEEQTEWLRTTVFRERDMDSVELALGEIPAHQNAEGTIEYYVRDQDTEEVFVVLFGEPVSD